MLKWRRWRCWHYVAVVFALHVNWGPGADVCTLMPTLAGGAATGPWWWRCWAPPSAPPVLLAGGAGVEQRQQLERSGGVPVESSAFTAEHLYRIKLDTVFGMLFSNLIASAWMLATAITLNGHGITEIQTTRDAALALRLIAGDCPPALFALGVIGTGMLRGTGAGRLGVPTRWPTCSSGAPARPLGGRGARFLRRAGGGHAGSALRSTSPLDPIWALLWSAVKPTAWWPCPWAVAMMWLGRSALRSSARNIADAAASRARLDRHRDHGGGGGGDAVRG